MPSNIQQLVEKSSGFDWDNANKTKNWLKHKVKWNEIEEIFFNKPLFIESDEKHSTEEIRYWALGKTNAGRLLFISFTLRSDKIRVISARVQNKKERSVYEQAA